MALKSHSKKHLTNLLDHLEESHSQLQQLLSDFVTQVVTNTRNWMATPDNNMTFKDAVTMVTTANTTLLEYIEQISEDSRVSPGSQMSEDVKVPTAKLMQDSSAIISDEVLTNILKRLETVESTVSMLQSSQKKDITENEMKTQEETILNWKCEIEKKLKTLSTTQKQNYKMFKKQLKEQDNTINGTNKEMESLKENKLYISKEVEMLIKNVKENENTLHKLQSDLMANVDQNAKENEILKENLQNILSKYHMISSIVQQRLMPMDKLMQILNQNSTTNKQKWIKVQTIEKDILKMSMEIRKIAYQEVRCTALGFTASDVETDKKTTLLQFNNVMCNVGNHFNLKSGKFTAPCDGIYLANLNVKQAGEKSVKLLLECQRKNSIENIGSVNTAPDKKQTSCSSVFAMECGDVLYLLSLTYLQDIGDCKFSCFLLGVK